MQDFIVQYLDKAFMAFILKLLISGLAIGVISSFITEVVKIIFERSIWKNNGKKIPSLFSTIISMILVIGLSFVFVSLITISLNAKVDLGPQKIRPNLESIILNTIMVMAIAIPACVLAYEFFVKNFTTVSNIWNNKVKRIELNSENALQEEAKEFILNKIKDKE